MHCLCSIPQILLNRIFFKFEIFPSLSISLLTLLIWSYMLIYFIQYIQSYTFRTIYVAIIVISLSDNNKNLCLRSEFHSDALSLQTVFLLSFSSILLKWSGGEVLGMGEEVFYNLVIRSQCFLNELEFLDFDLQKHFLVFILLLIDECGRPVTIELFKCPFLRSDKTLVQLDLDSWRADVCFGECPQCT